MSAMLPSDDPLALCWPHFHARDFVRAETQARQQLERLPDDPRLWYFLGLIAQMQERLDEAERHYLGALQRSPDFAEVRGNLGLLYQSLGRHADAEPHLREAVRLQPNDPVAHYNLGQGLAVAGNHAEAEQVLLHAIKLQPFYIDALRRLGTLYLDTGRAEQAMGCLLDVMTAEPTRADIHLDLGRGFQMLERWENATPHFLEATRYDPDNPQTWLQFAHGLLDECRADEARAPLQHVKRLDPANPALHNALGIAAMQQGHDEEARACFDETLRLDPNFTIAQLNRAIVLLRQENFEEGLPALEARCLINKAQSDRPAWDGSPLEGRTLLLCAEQGLGDMIQSIRYAPLVRESGGRCVVRAPLWLHPILKTCEGIDDFCDAMKPSPPHDVHAWMMSLPYLLGCLYGPVPYLKANAKLVEQWRGEIGAYPGLKVALAWQGSTKFRGDKLRSIPLAAFEPLAKVPGVTLLSVQKYTGEEQVAECADRMKVVPLGPRLDEEHGGFMDTAAVLSLVDLFITSDSAIAHLAGALGVRTFLAVPLVPDWRWLREGNTTRWYPSLRLYRQTQAGQWDDVVAAMAADLQKVVRAKAARKK